MMGHGVPLSECRRILIVKLSSIGDVVMATPVAKALRKFIPDAYIAWAVEEKSKDVVIGNPYLDDVIVWRRTALPAGGPLRKFGFSVGELRRLAAEMRSRRFDVAIDLQGLLRSACVTWASGAGYRIGYDNAESGAGLFYNLCYQSRRRSVDGVRYYLGILELLGVVSTDTEMHVPISEADRLFARQFVAREMETSGGRRHVAALCPATTWPSKHWTEQGWAQVADWLASERGALPVFLGSSADASLVARIQGLMKSLAASAVGKTSLNQAAALIEQSELVVAVDTGLMHVSLALERPTVGIFGPTKWSHLPRTGNLLAVARDLDCMPCHRHPTCRGFPCMVEITAQDVMSAASSLLDRGMRQKE